MEISAFQRVVSGGMRLLRQTLQIRNPTNTSRFTQRQSTGGQVARFSANLGRLLISRDSSLLNSRVKSCVWESISYRLRKQGVQRLMSGLNGRSINNAARSYITLLSFGFVGFALSEDGGDVAHNLHTTIDIADLEELSATIRKANESRQDEFDCGEVEAQFPERLDGYVIQNGLIAKGCFGATYPARLRDPVNSRSSGRNVLVNDTGISRRDQEGLDSDDPIRDGATTATRSATDSHENEEDQWELVGSQEKSHISEPDMNPEATSIDSTNLSDWSLVSVDNSDSRCIPRDQVDRASSPPQVELQNRSDGSYHFEGGFNLAIKICVGCASNEAIFETEKIVLDEKQEKSGRRQRLIPHPNIIGIHGAFTEENVSADRFQEARSLFPEALPAHQFKNGNDKLMFLVMKRYDMTLQDYVREFGCSDELLAKTMLCQCLEGAAHLASLGVAHRDLKSDNILVRCRVDSDDLVDGSGAGIPLLVISDFGCCLDAGEAGLRVPLDLRTRLVGNGPLRAPEIDIAFSDYWAGFLDYRKSDGWALGAIAYEMCGLANPFYAPGASPIGYKDESLPRLPDFVSPEFDFVIRGLLRKDPEQRLGCREAADMLHLLLWRPECRSKGPLSLRRIPYLRRILYSWLRDVAYPEDGCFSGETSQVMRQLRTTFLSNVNIRDLMEAEKKLISVGWQAWLQSNWLQFAEN